MVVGLVGQAAFSSDSGVTQRHESCWLSCLPQQSSRSTHVRRDNETAKIVHVRGQICTRRDKIVWSRVIMLSSLNLS